MKLYKQKRKQNSTALQLFGENSDVATKNDVSESTGQNVAQQLILKRKLLPIESTENTETKGKDFSRLNGGKSLYLLNMMLDDSTALHEEQIQNRIMERSENELVLTYLPCGQSILMMKYVPKQILENRPKSFWTFLETYSLDVEVIMEVEQNELKHFGKILFEGSKETQLVELNENQMCMMKLVITGKTMTPKGEKVLWKYSVVLCESVENNPMVNELEYGLCWNFIAAEKEHSKQPINMTLNPETSERQRQLMAN